MKSVLPFIIFAGLTGPVSDAVRAGEMGPGKLPVIPAVNPEPSGRHFRISAGAGWRTVGGVNFITGSRSGQLRLPFLAAAPGRRDSLVGSASEYADRTYRDGYVNQDAGTAGDGSTWYWGYEEAGQISSGNVLSYQGQGGSSTQNSRSTETRDAEAWGTETEGEVPVIQLDWEYDLTPAVRAGLSLQYSLLGFDGNRASQTFAASQGQVSREMVVTDLYDLGEVVAPQAPYQGSLEGAGPLIENRPGTRIPAPGRVIDRSQVVFHNRIQESLEVDLHRFAFGPSVAARLGKVDLILGAGLALNVTDFTATHAETLYVKKDGQPSRIYRRWQDRRSGTDVLPGFYLQAAARVALTSRLSLTAFGSHDWSSALTGDVGPSGFEIDPSGWTVGGMLGFTF